MKANRNKQSALEKVKQASAEESAAALPGMDAAGVTGSAALKEEPQPVPERPRTLVADPPAGWDVFHGLLRGLGLLSTQLNDYRLYLPVELRRRLGDLLDLPWVVSFWCEGCLRAIPHYLWATYVDRLRHETERLGQAELVDEAVVQPASVIHLEHGGRWHLPHSLAELGKIDGGSLCLLCPSDGGVEIWDAIVKQERLRAIVGKLDHKLVTISRPMHFALPSSPSPTRPTGVFDPMPAPHGNGHVT